MGCDVEVKKSLANLTLVRARSLPQWLRKLPGGVLPPGEVLELERLARTPGTWIPERSADVPQSVPPPVPPPPTSGAKRAEASGDPPITVRR
jgi:hypothetical protein